MVFRDTQFLENRQALVSPERVCSRPDGSEFWITLRTEVFHEKKKLEMDRYQRPAVRLCLSALRGDDMNKLLLLLFLSPTLAWASPFVCFTGRSTAAAPLESGVFVAAWNEGESATPQLAMWNPSCETIEHVETGLKATSLVFSGVGFGLACTGVGLPATVWLQGASIGTSVLGLIVGQLPCDNSSKNSEIKRLAEQVVCEELTRQGIRCDFSSPR